jgi:hypothetical protein
MGRPTDWTPLGLSADPVPGDPDQISQEAVHLSRVAKTLTDEIAALKKISAGGADGALKGQYADTIHSSASSLAGQLDKVVGRYQKASSALTQWVPDLEQAQRDSAAALRAAEGPARTLQAQPGFPTTGVLTPAQQQDKQTYDRTQSRAQSDLGAAKIQLAKAVGFRDERASYYAGLINSAIDDGVHDSFWDQFASAWDSFSHFVGEYAWLIKDICTVLEIIATVLAIIALFATGVGWLLLAAFVLTAVALALRTVLAATGNGSWLDVAMDAFALLTLGIGGGISGSGGLVARATATVGKAIDVGDTLATAERATSLSGRAAAFFGKIASFIGDTWYIPDSLAKPFETVSQIASDLNDTLHPLASTMVKSLEDTTAWERIFNTGEEPALLAKKMVMIADRFPASTEISQLSSKLSGQLWQLRGVVGAGQLGAVTGIGGGGITLTIPGLNWGPFQNGTILSTPTIPGLGPGWSSVDDKLTASLPTILHGFIPASSSW